MFKYSFLPFPFTSPPDPSHPYLLPLIPSPLGFVHVSFIVVSENPSPFPPPFPPQPSPPPSPHPTPLGFVHVSFIVVSVNPSPFSPIIPSHLPSGYCQIVLHFNVSGYILLACLFVLLIRFQLKVRSYGICLSPPSLFHLA